MTGDKRNILRLAKDGERTCLDCEWGTSLFGGDNRFEIIAKVKEHLLKATNIEMHPEELAQVDNILFRLWQLNYFNQCNLVNCSGRENKIELIKTKKKLAQAKELIKNIVRVTWNEGWNYSLDWKVKAEEFLKENN